MGQQDPLGGFRRLAKGPGRLARGSRVSTRVLEGQLGSLKSQQLGSRVNLGSVRPFTLQ